MTTGLLDQPISTIHGKKRDPFLLLDPDMTEALKIANEHWAIEARARDEEDIAAEVRRSLEAIYADHIEARKERSPATLKVYLRAFNDFALWCLAQHALPEIDAPRSLPSRAETLASYLHSLFEAGASPAKLRLVVAAVSQAHRFKQVADPTEDELIAGILKASRERASPIRKKKRHLNGNGTTNKKESTQ